MQPVERKPHWAVKVLAISTAAMFIGLGLCAFTSVLSRSPIGVVFVFGSAAVCFLGVLGAVFSVLVLIGLAIANRPRT